MKIGFIGLGNMGSAMLGGILKNGVVEPSDVIGAEVNRERRKEIEEKCGITTTDSNQEVAQASDMIVLAVKPQQHEKHRPQDYIFPQFPEKSL